MKGKKFREQLTLTTSLQDVEGNGVSRKGMGLYLSTAIFNVMNINNFLPSNPIFLDRVERYDASKLNCYAFCRGTDSVDGHRLAIGNMVSVFPLEIEGVKFHNSDCALMGKILMLCRDAAAKGTTPDIDIDLLRSKNIYLLGKRLTF